MHRMCANNMKHRIGILSDTHLSSISRSFRHLAETAFFDCETIVHAGDLCDISILQVFADKTVYAVHGNMCNARTRVDLPEFRFISIAGYSFAICHGAGYMRSVSERLFERFPEADCIISGHTHQQAVHRIGSTLLVNPGSFQGSGPYGSPGSYAILEIGENGLSARLHTLPRE